MLVQGSKGIKGQMESASKFMEMPDSVDLAVSGSVFRISRCAIFLSTL